MSRLRHVAHRAARPIVVRAGRVYVAGSGLEQGLAAVRALGGGATLAYWAPADAPPGDTADAYVRAAEALAEVSLRARLAIKLPMLGGDDAALERVLEALRAVRLPLVLDALGSGWAEWTLSLACELAHDGLEVGAAVPGVWSRSDEDAARLAAAGACVRVVRGQWPGDRPSGTGFLAVTAAAAAAGGRVCVCTHDPELARAALAAAPDGRAELELLWGLPRTAALRVAAEAQVPARLYVPYGFPYVPYALADVRERPRILWWLARDAVRRPPAQPPP